MYGSYGASKYFRPFRVGRFHVYRLAFASSAKDALYYQFRSVGFSEAFANMAIDPRDLEEGGKAPSNVLLHDLQISDSLAVIIFIASVVVIVFVSEKMLL